MSVAGCQCDKPLFVREGPLSSVSLISHFGKSLVEIRAIIGTDNQQLTLATPNASLVRTYASSLPCADGGGDGLRFSPAL